MGKNDDDREVDWDDPVQAMAAVVSAYKVWLARLFALRESEGTLAELVAAWRAGEVSLAHDRDGLSVMEQAPVPPPSGNN